MRGKTAEDLKLLELLDPVAEAAGYDIVRLRLMGGVERRRLQIMAERPDGEMLVVPQQGRLVITTSPGCTRRAAAPLIPRTPEPRSPAIV